MNAEMSGELGAACLPAVAENTAPGGDLAAHTDGELADFQLPAFAFLQRLDYCRARDPEPFRDTPAA